MKVPRLFFIGGALLVAGATVAIVVPRITDGKKIERVDASESALANKYSAPAVGLCPWRNQISDLKCFFPTASSTRDDTLALSRFRLEIMKRLGRPVTGDDLVLQIHRVYQGDMQIGAIVARRVSGENGAIEVAVAIDTSNSVIGVNIQRIRELPKTTNLLRSKEFLGGFIGKNAETLQPFGCGQVEIDAQSAKSAHAAYEGVRVILTLLAIGSAQTPTGLKS